MLECWNASGMCHLSISKCLKNNIYHNNNNKKKGGDGDK